MSHPSRSRSTLAKTLVFGLVAGLGAVSACSTSSNPGAGSCAPPPFLETACESCVTEACAASVEEACNAGGAFSNCYCPCVAGGKTPAECTLSCASSSCASTVVSCVEGSLAAGGACASGCGTAPATGGGMDSGADSTVGPGMDGAADTGVDAASDTGSATDSSVVPMESCLGGDAGLTNCGTANESCCTTLAVTGGTFYRTYTNTGDGGTGEANPATISSFRLDKYDVTVGRFRQFVNAWNGGNGFFPAPGSGKHTHLNGGNGLVNSAPDAGSTYEPGWVASDDAKIQPTIDNLTTDCVTASAATWTMSPGSQENLPMNCVNWYEAYAFCIWDGGFLPSQAEWEYAAGGGAMQLEYPWGSTDPGTANQYAIYACNYPSSADNVNACEGVMNIAPVGTASMGGGVWGQLDLVGNLHELNMDTGSMGGGVGAAYHSYPVGLSPGYGGGSGVFINPCTDCAELGTARSTGSNDSDLGFRCARTP